MDVVQDARKPIKRNRRSFREMLLDACSDVPHHRPTRDDLRDRLPNLTDVQFEATLQATLDDPHSGLEVGPGGRYFRYYGSEGTGAVGQIAIYAVVRSKLEQGWGPRRGMRHVETFDTSRSGRRDGSIWVHPDVVLREQRRRRTAGDPPNIVVHTFEIEHAGAFDIGSVYQAHAQGRGADYSWVAFHDIGRLAGRDAGAQRERARVVATATELGIGLVAFKKPNNLETWTTIDAMRRRPTPEERALFEDRVMPRVPAVGVAVAE